MCGASLSSCSRLLGHVNSIAPAPAPTGEPINPAVHGAKGDLTVPQRLITEIREVWDIDASMLVKKHQELTTVAASIQEALVMEVKRGTFDRGRCKLCP